MTTVNDMLFQLGGMPVLPFAIPPGGTWFWVDTVLGSASNDGLAPVANNAGHGPLAKVGQAYAKTTANKNDVVVLIGKATASDELEALTWSNSYTHLIGLCSPVHEGQRSRITCGAVDLSPFITISANGCIFANLRVVVEQADVHNLLAVSVTGERNYFYNCDFAGPATTTNAIDGAAALHINGGSENLFDRCTIGLDTVSQATGCAGLVFAATGAAARNVFRGCFFNAYAGNANVIFVELLGNSGIDRYQIFDRCTFQNLSSTAMTSAFAVAAGFDANNKRVLLRDCALIGATDWDSNNRGILYLNNGTITGGGNTGLFAVSNST